MEQLLTEVKEASENLAHWKRCLNASKGLPPRPFGIAYVRGRVLHSRIKVSMWYLMFIRERESALNLPQRLMKCMGPQYTNNWKDKINQNLTGD